VRHRERNRIAVLAMAGATVALVLGACAKSGTAGGGGGGGPTIATTSIQGIGSVLVAPDGMTLYHLTTESSTSIKCTGSCPSVWPPLLETNGALPAAGDGVTGTLGTITRPDGGVQVTYDGQPMYTYSGDSQAGQANGQGIQGVWFAVTPTGGASASPSSSGRGGGY
jgi:predicted lipoprotein with Yx(FWY)xxD motif